MEILVEDAEEENAEDVEVEGKKTITIHSRILYFFLTPISIYFITAYTMTEVEERRGECVGRHGGRGGGCGVEDAMVEDDMVEEVERMMVLRYLPAATAVIVPP